MGDADIVEDHAQEAHGPSLANKILLERQRSAKKLWSKVCAPTCRLSNCSLCSGPSLLLQSLQLCVCVHPALRQR